MSVPTKGKPPLPSKKAKQGKSSTNETNSKPQPSLSTKKSKADKWHDIEDDVPTTSMRNNSNNKKRYMEELMPDEDDEDTVIMKKRRETQDDMYGEAIQKSNLSSSSSNCPIVDILASQPNESSHSRLTNHKPLKHITQRNKQPFFGRIKESNTEKLSTHPLKNKKSSRRPLPKIVKVFTFYLYYMYYPLFLILCY